MKTIKNNNMTQTNPDLHEASANTLRINAGGPRATTDRSRKSSLANSRLQIWQDTIRTDVEAIMKHAGSVVVSASEVLEALNALGLMAFPIRKANGLGNAMGVRGLKLPVILDQGQRLYVLLPLVMPAADWKALAADMQALSSHIADKNYELLFNATSGRIATELPHYGAAQ